MELPSDELLRLDQEMQTAKNLESARAITFRFIENSNKKTAGEIFEHMIHGAKDLASRLNKPISIDFTGKNVRLPRRFNEVFQTFVHILRNATDHGIEAKGARGAKNSAAQLFLRVREDSGSYEILFEDDGAGINLQRLQERVVENGFIDAQQWKALDRSTTGRPADRVI